VLPLIVTGLKELKEMKNRLKLTATGTKFDFFNVSFQAPSQNIHIKYCTMRIFPKKPITGSM